MNLPRGIDVSQWSGHVRWDVARDQGNIEWGMARASVDSRIDDRFVENKLGIVRAGLLFMAYLGLHPSEAVQPQIDAFCRALDPGFELDDMPAVLDVETMHVNGAETTAEVVHEALDRLESATGKTPIFYSYDSFIRDQLAGVDLSFLARYPLYLAHYGLLTPPTPPHPFASVAIWQSRGSIRFPGVENVADLNFFLLGDINAMRSFGARSSETMPAPPPSPFDPGTGEHDWRPASAETVREALSDTIPGTPTAHRKSSQRLSAVQAPIVGVDSSETDPKEK